MIRIAVCDDDPCFTEQIDHIIANHARDISLSPETVLYTSSGQLLYDVEEGAHFDLLLLDIEMPGSTGMETAEKIKPFLPNVKIIFITSHIEYAIDAFELSIFRYVPKNEIEKRLPSAIRDAVKLIELEEGKTYTIRTNSRLEKIPCREIYYIERDGKNAGIITAGGISKVRKSLQQGYEEWGTEECIYIDRGCIVNMIHIMQIKDGMAVLKNGVSLPISRSHLQKVKEQINGYWGMHI